MHPFENLVALNWALYKFIDQFATPYQVIVLD
jgi:hypothetical protein